MKRLLLLTSVSASIATAAACAVSNDDPVAVSPPPASAAPTEGGAAEPAPEDAGPRVSSCSKAGWCVTPMPDTDLVFRDVWPLPGHAFAIAESPTLGVKVLAWDDAGASWRYIDDDSQNAYGSGQYAGKIWAPNEDEVYFGVSPGYVYRGERPVPPATAWTWERWQLPDNARGTDPHGVHGHPTNTLMRVTYAALGVWGTGADDVYAWYGNTIFHRESEDGGAPSWVAEYAVEDNDVAEENLHVFAAAGTKDEVWFAGARDRRQGYSACPILIRKTTVDGYRRIVDGTADFNIFSPCHPRAGYLFLGGDGWLTDIQYLGPGSVVALRKAATLERVTAVDGGYAIDSSSIASPVPNQDAPVGFNSLWIHEGQAWLSGWGFVVRSADVPYSGDAGAFHISTIALGGTPLNRPIYRVRGTSNENLWAIGARYALHKTTP